MHELDPKSPSSTWLLGNRKILSSNFMVDFFLHAFTPHITSKRNRSQLQREILRVTLFHGFVLRFFLRNSFDFQGLVRIVYTDLVCVQNLSVVELNQLVARMSMVHAISLSIFM